MPIVAVQPVPQPRCAGHRRLERTRVGPFVQRGLNEALGLTVRARRIRTRSNVPQAHQLTKRSKCSREICRSVVGHNALDAHTAFCKPRDRTLQKAGGSITCFVGQDLDVRYARSVVDADVSKFPTNAAIRAAAPVAGDPMPDSTLNFPQFLDVNMNELSGSCTLVANHRLTRVQAIELCDTALFCNARHRSATPPDLRGNAVVGPTLTTKFFDARPQRIGHCRRHRGRPGSTIGHARLALQTVTLNPFEDRRASKAQRLGDPFGRFSPFEPSHDCQPTSLRQLCVLMAHHQTFSREGADPDLREGIRNLLREHS